jgi:hypothetical protein
MDSSQTPTDVETYLKKFWYGVALGANALVTTRTGFIGPELDNTGDSLTTRKLQDGDGNTTCIVGFYWKTPANWFASDLWQIACGGNLQCHFEVNSGGTLDFISNTNQGTSTYAFANNNEYFVEFKIVIHDSTGSMELKVADLTANGEDADPVSEWTLSGIDSRANTNVTETAWDQVAFRHSATSGQSRYDDIYICNGAGSTNNDFLGNIFVETLNPDGAGNSTQLTPSAGSNYQNVDETTKPDDDTTYNTADADGETDLYTVSNPTKTTDPLGVQVQALVRTTDADRRTIRLPIRNNAVDSEGSDIGILADTYQGRSRILETDANGDPWTNSLINGLEIGIKRQVNS